MPGFFESCLGTVALMQLGLALFNLALPWLLGWRDPVANLPLLIREVFYVHLVFISITCALFGTLTLRFSTDFAHGDSEPVRWLAGAIATFWGIRTVLQVTYYSRSHWQGKPLLTAVHVGFLLMYAGFTTTYAFAAFG